MVVDMTMIAKQPPSFWRVSTNQRLYFDSLAELLEIHDIEDWYKISYDQIVEHGGGGAFTQHGSNACFKVLQGIYPHTSWRAWGFNWTQRGYWDNPDNQKEFFHWLGDVLPVTEFTQWYQLRALDIVKYGGGGLLTKFGGSPGRALMNACPELPWQPWLFNPPDHFPPNYWNKESHRLQFVEWLANELQCNSHDDWYKVTEAFIVEKGGQGLLQYFGGSAVSMLKEAYPDVQWHPWIFGKASPDYCNDISNQRTFVEWIMQVCHVSRDAEWALVSQHDILCRGGENLLQKYGSLKNLVTTLYPHGEWHPWIFEVEASFWKSIGNQRRYMDWLAEQLDIKSIYEWYSLRKWHLQKWAGAALLRIYDGDIQSLIDTVFPTVEWQHWKFECLPENFWKSPTNRQKYFEWLYEQLDINTSEDWLDIDCNDILEREGGSILDYYGGSLSKLVEEACPIAWHPWIFEDMPRKFWENAKNRRQFFDWLAEQLNVADVSDWYTVGRMEILKWRVYHLVDIYHRGSHIHAITSAFPLTEWQMWRFTWLPGGFWENKANQRLYLDFLEEQLEIYEEEDWYGFSMVQIGAIPGGRCILLHNGGLLNLLEVHYPSHKWNPRRWKVSEGSKAQQVLLKMVKSLIPDAELEYNHLSSYLWYEGSQMPMQLDLWLPQYNLALEYQGSHHYAPVDVFESEIFHVHINHDIEKKHVCQENAIQLIQVPYWWNFQPQSLAATISQRCPDAVRSPHVHGIPSLPRRKLSKEYVFLPFEEVLSLTLTVGFLSSYQTLKFTKKQNLSK